MPIRFSLLNHLEHLLGTRHESLGGALHVRHPILVLVHRQIDLGHVEQIANLVHVDFVVGDLDVEFEVHLHAVDVIENVVDDARNDALLRGVAYSDTNQMVL